MLLLRALAHTHSVHITVKTNPIHLTPPVIPSPGLLVHTSASGTDKAQQDRQRLAQQSCHRGARTPCTATGTELTLPEDPAGGM